MSDIKGVFAVLGLSRFGTHAAENLYRSGAKVIVVDQDEKYIARIAPNVTKAVCANVLDWDVLEHIGVLSAETVIIGLRHTFDAAVLLAHHLKSQGRIRRIIAQADSEEKAAALKLLGVDEVVFPEKDTAERLVQRLALPGLLEHIPLSPELAIVEISVPAHFVGKSMIQLQIRARWNVHVIGLKRSELDPDLRQTLVAPPPDTLFKAGDDMLVLGRHEEIARFSDACRNE